MSSDAICNGCSACAMRCTAGVRISEFEYARIVEELRASDAATVRRVLRQHKELPWFEETTYTACLFLDTASRRCLIYPARPLVCRLFGRVTHLPCPAEKIKPDVDADHILDGYHQQTLLTFQEWMTADGVFDYLQLLGEAGKAAIYEVS